jgi:putative ABC transport system substrate-binding protein
MTVRIGRRKLITTLVGAVAWPFAARAQRGEHIRRIAILSDFSESQMQPLIAAFRERMQQLGWGDDTIRVDTRLGVTGAAQFQVAGASLVGTNPDVIVTLGSPALRAMKQETRTIPIVFTFVADPVGQGLIASLAHPGGNATGFTNFEFAFAGKWLEALKEIEPRISTVMVIVNPGNSGAVGLSEYLERLGPTYGVKLIVAPMRTAAEIESTITGFGNAPERGLIVLPDGLTVTYRDLTIEVTNRARLPAVFAFRTFASNGGLMSWGVNFSEIYRQAATYVDRILRGAKPEDLPVVHWRGG